LFVLHIILSPFAVADAFAFIEKMENRFFWKTTTMKPYTRETVVMEEQK
jgi:hypothetical protein